ncbi:hypothetical protein GO755_36190 [Spirosoma sp. HMF4905]|uniref:Uncharacterized protein n=1 Tax=Spirosoma arboris TaxID=2682092 RepID=A0A7K1SNY1_9BACT|nr:hypothetical protein [Spirosoma arboris]MVM35518.1 hypothetical protein [Spirosoma arboris]
MSAGLIPLAHFQAIDQTFLTLSKSKQINNELIDLAMIYFITTLDQQSNFRHFHFDHAELEAGFDVLNRIVAQGDVLVKAIVIDGKSIIHLPVEAFDGQSCQSAINALEREWSKLLDRPINK